MAGGSTGPWFRGLFHPTQTRIRVSNGEAATCRSACVCTYTHACRGGAWREGTRFPSPASRFHGCAPGGSSGREWPLLAEGRPPLLRLPVCPFLPKPSGSRPSPVPLVRLSPFLHRRLAASLTSFVSLCPPCLPRLFCHLFWTSVPCSLASAGFSGCCSVGSQLRTAWSTWPSRPLAAPSGPTLPWRWCRPAPPFPGRVCWVGGSREGPEGPGPPADE